MTDLSAHQIAAPTKISRTNYNALIDALEVAIDASGGSATGLTTAADRTALAALTPSNGDSIILTEGLRFGVFEFDSSNLSAKVTADTRQGIYVAPASDATGASGAWVRQFSGSAELNWFGAVADDNGTVGTDNAPAMQGALAALIARGNPGENNAIATESLHIADGDYYCSTTTELISTTRIWANGSGFQMEPNVRWRVPAATSGFIIQRANTSGESGTGASHTPGDGAALVGLGIIGGYAGTESEHHGVMMRARGLVMDCYIRGFPGDGICISASAPNGNANGWSAIRNAVSFCRYGLRSAGLDVNVGHCEQLDASYNRIRSIYDDSIGSKYTTCHSYTNGIFNPIGGVNYNGESYTVRPGYEAAATTNAPSGNTTDNTWWYWMATFTQAAWSTWTNGMAQCVSTGGPYIKNASNASVLSDCYSEAEGATICEGHSHMRGGIYSSRPPLGVYLYAQQLGYNIAADFLTLAGLGQGPQWNITTANGSLNFGSTALRIFSTGNGVVRVGTAIETGTGESAAQVVGLRGAAVADVSGGGTVDTECRAQLNTLLARLRAHGLIAS